MKSVKLIGITKPVIEGVDTTGQLLAFMARVSSTATQMNHETGPKLLKFLIKRKEWSPLEMIHFVVEIETTRDIGRQILRHRSFSFQEFSQRYAVPSDEIQLREARTQHPTDRQMSVVTDDRRLAADWLAAQTAVATFTREVYNEVISQGIAKEQARALLPEGLTKTKMYMAGSLRSWCHYVMLRVEQKTQKEHRLIAIECANIIAEQIPEFSEMINQLLEENK